ncbi:MAG: hypothetical protein ABFC67_06205 [Mizugakiibacter sp.]|uniref:hypothetical protein n=1 Tax=Mizugakiibacter sp. TaxID=1972610 RepID=UPI0031C8407B|nr:hypothetical protein [Xanthomonadaceae bacterium]
MPDRTDRMNAHAALADALRALPAPTPERDLWPLLAARARRRTQRRRYALFAVPAALAAALVLALVLPAALRAPRPAIRPSTAAVAGATAAARPGAAAYAAPVAELSALRERSQRLERWVHTLDVGGAPLGGRALAGATELEDMIGLVDVQLAAGGDARTQLPLWRQRVDLLEQLATLRLGGYAVADAGAATPTVWIN